MHITHSQLIKFLHEAIQLSDDNKEKAITALKNRLEDEGGAMSAEDAKETAEIASGVSMDDDDFTELAQDADIETHKSGDVVDTTGLGEGSNMKMTRRKLSEIIKEELSSLNEIDTSLTHEDAEYAYDTLAVRLRGDDDKVLNRAGTVKKLMTDPAGFEDMKQQIMQAMTHGHLKQNRAWDTTKSYWKEKLGLNEARLPFMEPLYAAGFKVVSSIPDAWSSLKSGESFSFEVPDGVAEALKTLLGGDSWTPGSALTLKESKRILTENPGAIIAGIGAGLLIIVLVAMVKGYSTDVEVGGKVAGQSAKAKIVLKAPSDSGQVNIGTQQGDMELDTLSEAAMVSLMPITTQPRASETMEARWAKLSGIPEEHINLNESIMDTTPMEDLMGTMAGEIADRFGNEMERLWDEDPAMMREQGYTDKSQWSRQVGSAELALEDELQQVMSQALQNVETQLHDGQFYDERDSRSSMGGRDSNNDGALDADELRNIADDLEG
jgi:hypothetical protein